MRIIGAIISLITVVFSTNFLHSASAQQLDSPDDWRDVPDCIRHCFLDSGNTDFEDCIQDNGICTCLSMPGLYTSFAYCAKGACSDKGYIKGSQAVTEACRGIGITFTENPWIATVTLLPRPPEVKGTPSATSTSSISFSSVSFTRVSSSSSTTTSTSSTSTSLQTPSPTSETAIAASATVVKSGLSGGAIVGIAVGVGLPIIAVVGYMMYRLGTRHNARIYPVASAFTQNCGDPEVVTS
ncbi:hypothetical protein TWF696_004756 [Orbilia brochopaga]|uniref:CFEM domain-containing protein n=1 Tax=Orbilia brochopaga TaxID=3140254 RepID=A0AAV9UZG0_9PEZI